MDSATPIHESSAFQLFIFHIYILSFSFFVIIRNANIAHLEKVKSINECMCTATVADLGGGCFGCFSTPS